ncbi:hypothetical protein LPJ78_001066 [Coemansia sp. RSA 989]|nr:hypothetical protein BX667DRAFT_502519 [Coemansia mojavensis]KAJ1739501.1 hypothetical protein LPJ68_004628 [Coemansia sp. RSA 1086]KAJ1752241.1 hypothetical protein LPJ79_001429 [Coemansia sp. RSA 1821]KAJ1867384.1 hypothetical protein LPJ78_001066 [Coemansia sp. RSA 989]KAJ1873770.1 hypothetical protein LPJ55_002005 [Coemansia sp. RSA 990]KAJ2671978.1 hypothetical protein IWW42_003067 [Coemansia sp. RSA 1085]
MALQKGSQKQLTKRPKVAVLEEDEYRATIDQIIERDFFPDIRRLQAEKKELVDGTVEPADLPEPASKQSLNEFLSTHTSEDNASFSKLLATENKRRQARRIGLQNQLTMGNSPGTSRNALMFMPDGITKQSVASDKQIVYQNTRFAETLDVDDLESVISEATTTGYRTPEINGYRMVDSPRGFSIAPRTPRELAGLQLASPSKRKTSSKPANRKDMLSPAAQRLLGRSQKSNSADNSIRSAYNSPFVRR